MDITEGWAKHFSNLATPTYNVIFDGKFKEMVDLDKMMMESLSQGSEISKPTRDEFLYAVRKLNNSKAADVIGITADHIKNGNNAILEYIISIIEMIFIRKKIPTSLKEGVITHVFKKGDTKSIKLLKLIEHVINKRHWTILEPTQSRLQIHKEYLVPELGPPGPRMYRRRHYDKSATSIYNARCLESL